MIPTLMCNPVCGVQRGGSLSPTIKTFVSTVNILFLFVSSPPLFLCSSSSWMFLNCFCLVALSFFLVPPFSPVLMLTFLLPPLPPLLSPFLFLSLHCCSSSTSCCCLSSSSSSSPSWWLRVNSWRCCSTASVCPACRANPTPHQALGPSTPTKYFYLFIQPRPSGPSWR